MHVFFFPDFGFKHHQLEDMSHELFFSLRGHPSPSFVEQVLKGAVESQGAQGSFMKLSDLRADLSVRAAQGHFLWD